MKYLITENQKEKILDFIKDFIDGYFSPKDNFGNKNWKNFRKELEDTNDGEIFIYFGDMDNYEFMTFYSCEYVKNYDLDLDCPHLMLESKDYEKLEAMFGDVWKPIMKDWFFENTGVSLIGIHK